jgi:hypothetical protein
MDNEGLLIVAMAAKCRDTIQKPRTPQADLPKPLRAKHLKSMCDEIEKHADDWSTAKLNRWIGFVQCAMLANYMLDLDELKRMFDEAKVAHGEISDDLLDHLDPRSSFKFDVGGEG